MIYITGDKHGDYEEVLDFCKNTNTTYEDVLIVLGDAGINYFLNERDYELKKKLKETPITFFCVHGNHEERPYNIESYKTKKFHEGLVYYEEDYPNILFAEDGEIYNFNEKKTIVIGGAYSVDKEYRLAMGFHWYPSEQPTDEIKKHVIDTLKNNNNKIDIILSHTCPYKHLKSVIPLNFVDQSTVDNSTENFLDYIDDTIEYECWYCGHHHVDRTIDKIRFMFHDIEELKRKIKKR